LAEVGSAAGGLGFLFGLRKGREQEGRQDTDDCQHHQQFNERKRPPDSPTRQYILL
jgi:hypothetical protein